MRRVISIGVVSSAILTFVHVAKTNAQIIPNASRQEGEIKEMELDEVTITAFRSEMPLSRAAIPVAVIHRDVISQAPVKSIEELLVYVANIDVVQRGGHGVQSDISIRGGSADQTAILLNGVNLSNPQTGHYSFDLPVNLSDIERIEILHGPSALFYGSNAFSGGINIITKKHTDTRFYAKAMTGMHALLNTELRGAYDLKNTSNSLSFSYKKSDGYTENSDYGIYQTLWQTRLRPTHSSRLDFMAGYVNKSYGANTFYSAAYPNQYDRASRLTGAINGMFGDKIKWIPQIYWLRHFDQFDLIKGSEQGRNYHRGDTYGANLIFRCDSRIGITHFGGEWRREEIASSRLGKPLNQAKGYYTHADERQQANLIVEHSLSLQKFIFSGGVLANYNTLQNDQIRWYPSLNIAYKPTYALQLFTSWSRSNRLPTFTDLYYTTETHHANETLQVERSESFDLGVAYKHPNFQLTLTGYLMKGRNMIDWVRESSQEKWASWNHTQANKQGIEAQLFIPIHPLFSHCLGQSSALTISYARMNQTCDSKGLESRYTLNYLRDKLTTGFHLQLFKSLSASANFRFQKRMGIYRRYENGADKGIHPYPAFSTLDVKLSYELKKLTFHVDINNLYNTRYYDVGNVPQAGFWLSGGVSYNY
jgi:iron complex outermembrane receptor protein